jgi:hypothetical protein
MFSNTLIEMAGYAVLPALLALVIAVLFVPGIRRSLDFRPGIIPRNIFHASVLIAACIFILLLVFLGPWLSAAAFLAGVFSAILFLFFSRAVFESAGLRSSEEAVHRAGLSFSLGAPGLALLAAGIFLLLFAWKDVPVLNAYALGAACTLFIVFFSAATGKDEDPAVRPAAQAADFYVSSLCVLVAALAIGTVMEEFQLVWIGMPVLFFMTGLSALIAAALVAAATYGRPLFLRFLAFLPILAGISLQYAILRELTRKMSANTIANLGMLDRMGPFWALISGIVTGVLLIVLSRNASDSSGRGNSRMVFAFSLYFVAVGLWMSYIFADLYGIAFAGIGMLGAVSFPAGQRIVRSMKGDQGGGNGFMNGGSVFATVAVAAAYLMWVREAVDLEDGLIEISVIAGLVLGVETVYVMSLLAKRLSGRSLKESAILSPLRGLLLSGIVVFLVPLLIGFAAGPEMLGGLLLGMALPGIYEVFRMEKQGESEEARCLNGLMRLAALVSLVSVPLLTGF